MKPFLLMAALLWGTIAATAQRRSSDESLMTAFRDQRYGDAAAFLEPQVQREPANAYLLSLLGYAYYMGSQMGPAEDCFTNILAMDSANASALFYLAKISLAKGDRQAARERLCRLVDLKPGVAAYYKPLAGVNEALGLTNVAGYYYALAHAASPGDAAVSASLAGWWLDQEYYHRADSLLDIALAADSMEARLITVRIRSAYEQDDYALIIRLSQRLRQMQYYSLAPYLMTAVAYLQTKQYQECIAICRLLSDLKLASATVLYMEAMAHKALHEYKESLALLDACLALSLDDDADGYFSAKGDIFEQLGQPRQALAQFDTAYYLFRRPLQLYNKGRMYDRLKNPRTALRFYHRYLEQSRDTVPPEEHGVWAYANRRARQLEAWEAAARKQQASAQ